MVGEGANSGDKAMSNEWYVVVRDEKDEKYNKGKPYTYPLNIYADKGRAEIVAKANGYRVVAVISQDCLHVSLEAEK